jgi:hypothetical protein
MIEGFPLGADERADARTLEARIVLLHHDDPAE